MAWSAGTVTVDSMGAASGSGLSLALYNKRKAARDALLAPMGLPPQPLASKVNSLRQLAAFAQADAEALVQYLVPNAEIDVQIHPAGLVDPGDFGLQQVMGVDTDAPAFVKHLAGVLS